MKIPYWFSGRIYYSYGSKMNFQVVRTVDGRTGTVQPTPWNDSDTSRYEDRDFSELTYSQWGLYLNSTQVDMVSNPAVVSGSGDNTMTSGGIKASGFDNLVNSISKVKGFEKSVQLGSDGKPLRVLAPAHFVDTNNDTKTYLDPYINRVWDHYSSNSLTVQPDPTNHPEIKYTGKVINGTFVFTKNGDASGYSIKLNKPSTSNVWGCDGDPAGNSLFAGKDNTAPAAREDERGTVVRSICADLHRGVLGTQDVAPSTNASTYYQVNSMNGGLFDWYSKYVHENMLNGKAYGFAIGDVGGYESLVHIINPKTASIDVINRTTGKSDATQQSSTIKNTSLQVFKNRTVSFSPLNTGKLKDGASWSDINLESLAGVKGKTLTLPQGTLRINSNRTVAFIPKTDFTGTVVSVKFNVTTSAGETLTAYIYLTVK